MKETFENDLNTQGFPYQEAYWKDMEKLLDKRRKPIVFFKRLALILLLTGAVVLSYTLLEKSSRIAVIKAKSVAGKSDQQVSMPNTKPTQSALKPEKPEAKHNAAVNSGIKHAGSHSFYKPASEAETDASELLKTAAAGALENSALPGSGFISETPSAKPEDKNSLSVLSTWIPDSSALQPAGICYGNPVPLPADTGSALMHTFKPNAVALPVITKLRERWSYALRSEIRYTQPQCNKASAETQRGSERLLPLWDYSLQVLAVKRRISLSAGLGYKRTLMQSHYSVQTTHETYDTSFIMVNPFYSQTPGGSRIALLKTQIDTSRSTFENVPFPNAKTHFSYLSIPLQAAYTVHHRKLAIGFEAGFNTLFLLQARGIVAGSQSGLYGIYESADLKEVRRILFNGGLGMRISYPIYKRNAIGLFYGQEQNLSGLLKSDSRRIFAQRFGLAICFGL